MINGRIEQRGTPHDIFTRPETEFVARFIGGHNVVPSDGGKIAVRTDRVQVGRLNGQASPAGTLEASVRDVEYQGTYVQLGLASEGVLELVATLPEERFFSDPLNPGDRVCVSWHAADAHRLADPLSA